MSSACVLLDHLPDSTTRVKPHLAETISVFTSCSSESLVSRHTPVSRHAALSVSARTFDLVCASVKLLLTKDRHLSHFEPCAPTFLCISFCPWFFSLQSNQMIAIFVLYCDDAFVAVMLFLCILLAGPSPTRSLFFTWHFWHPSSVVHVSTSCRSRCPFSLYLHVLLLFVLWSLVIAWKGALRRSQQRK